MDSYVYKFTRPTSPTPWTSTKWLTCPIQQPNYLTFLSLSIKTHQVTMYPSLNMFLLGAALASASPIAPNITIFDRSTKKFPANSTNGHTPSNSTGVDNFLADLKKCNYDGYEKCLSSGRKDCDDELDKGGECTIKDFIKDILGPSPEIPEGVMAIGGGKVLVDGSWRDLVGPA